MFELSYEDMDGYIQQIGSSEKIAYVKDFREEEVPILFKYPTSKNKLLAEYQLKKYLAEAQEMGLPTIEEMEETIRLRKIFTAEDEAKIEKLNSRIAGQEAILAKTTRVPARRDRLKEVISTLKSEVEAIQYKREISLELTQERKALEGKFLYLTHKGTFSPETGEPFWENRVAFDDEPDFLFRKRVFV